MSPYHFTTHVEEKRGEGMFQLPSAPVLSEISVSVLPLYIRRHDINTALHALYHAPQMCVVVIEKIIGGGSSKGSQVNIGCPLVRIGCRSKGVLRRVTLGDV